MPKLVRAYHKRGPFKGDIPAEGLNIVDDNVARYNLGVPADPVAFVFIFGRVARSGGAVEAESNGG
ncbi:hypothetical protein PG990_006728 [Apiospora arundinis]